MAHIIINPLIHAVIINPSEKQIVRTLSGDAQWAKRPTSVPYGMPSGHAETFTVLSYLLYKKGIINGWACASIITLVGLQRIVYNRHTLLQVIAGTCLGLLYGHLYSRSKNPLIQCLIIALAFYTLSRV
jgi:membrane-associated phospholipid phosphatase